MKNKGGMDREMSTRRCPHCRTRHARERLQEKLKARKKQEEAHIHPPIQVEEANLAAAENQKKKRKRKKKMAKGKQVLEQGQVNPSENTSNVSESIKADEVANSDEILVGNSKEKEKLKARKKQEEAHLNPPIQVEEANLAVAENQKKKRKRKTKAKGKQVLEQGQANPSENTSNVSENIKADEVANSDEILEENSKEKDELNAREKQEEAHLNPPIQAEEANLAAAENQKKKRKRKKKKAKGKQVLGQTNPSENTSNVSDSIKADEVANSYEILEGNSKKGDDMTDANEKVQKTDNKEDTLMVEGKQSEKEELKSVTTVVKKEVIKRGVAADMSKLIVMQGLNFKEELKSITTVVKKEVIKREVAADMSKLIVMQGLKFKNGVCHAMLARNNDACDDIVAKVKDEINSERQLQSSALIAFSLKGFRIATTRIYLSQERWLQSCGKYTANYAHSRELLKSLSAEFKTNILHEFKNKVDVNQAILKLDRERVLQTVVFKTMCLLQQLKPSGVKVYMYNMREKNFAAKFSEECPSVISVKRIAISTVNQMLTEHVNLEFFTKEGLLANVILTFQRRMNYAKITEINENNIMKLDPLYGKEHMKAQFLETELKEIPNCFGNMLLEERTADMKFNKENRLNEIESKKKVLTASNGEQTTKHDGQEDVLRKFNLKVAPQRRALSYYILKNGRSEVVRLQENGDEAKHEMKIEQKAIRRARYISFGNERTVKWKQYEQRKKIVLNIGVGRMTQKSDVSHLEPSKEAKKIRECQVEVNEVLKSDENLSNKNKAYHKAKNIGESQVEVNEVLEWDENLTNENKAHQKMGVNLPKLCNDVPKYVYLNTLSKVAPNYVYLTEESKEFQKSCVSSTDVMDFKNSETDIYSKTVLIDEVEQCNYGIRLCMSF